MLPNLAVIERLRERGVAFVPHLLVSERPLDARLAGAAGVPYTALPARPFGLRPAAAWRCWRGYRAARRQTAERVRAAGGAAGAAALLATGGFVSGPAAAGARRAGARVAVLNLDATAGRANRHAERFADARFRALPPAETEAADDATVTGYPLRMAARAERSKHDARAALGLDPGKRTLLVFAGSQGARTINRALRELLAGSERGMLAGSQVLHLCGGDAAREDDAATRDGLAAAYRDANVPAVVRHFCERMGDAWAAADLALTRCGAGTVAEAWANAVPCLMLPYPFHRDQHQRANAAPLVALNAAVVEDDRVEPAANVEMLRRTLGRLLKDDARRSSMRHALRENPPPDGADALADWLTGSFAGAGAGAGAGASPRRERSPVSVPD